MTAVSACPVFCSILLLSSGGGGGVNGTVRLATHDVVYGTFTLTHRQMCVIALCCPLMAPLTALLSGGDK